jgi:hypothetical protein
MKTLYFPSVSIHHKSQVIEFIFVFVIGNVTNPYLVGTTQLDLSDKIIESYYTQTIGCSTPVLFRNDHKPVLSVPLIKAISTHCMRTKFLI